MIVVKKSLEKKCEKVVSGRRSKTPRESTKETKLTKMRKRSSKRMSRSSKSKTSDNEEEENTTDRDESPEKNVQVGESAARRWRTSLDRPAEEDEAEGEGEDNKMESRMMEFGEFVDGTDSTSQETVERVVVTAMVHKDQVPDTPKSATTSVRRSSPSRKEEDIDLSFSENKTISARLEEVEEVNDKREGKNVCERAAGNLHRYRRKINRTLAIVIFCFRPAVRTRDCA